MARLALVEEIERSQNIERSVEYFPQKSEIWDAERMVTQYQAETLISNYFGLMIT